MRVALLLVATLAVWGSVSASAVAGVPRSGMRLVQAGGGDGLRIGVAPVIAVAPAAEVPLQIRVMPLDALPRNSFLRVRGLPPTVSLSQGYVTAPGSWTVPINGLGALQMVVPAGVSGRSELVLSLVSEDGTLLAEARAALVVQPPVSAAAAAPPPAAPTAPVITPSAREAAEKFIARGEAELAKGSIATARQFFLRAAQLGAARGALLLATTYDPRELARLGVHGVQPNLGEARKWYERARELGAPEAEGRLAGLGGS